MFTFNRNEQIAILALTALLIVGSVVSAVDYFWPSSIDDFEVRKGAIRVPEILQTNASVPEQPGPININTATPRELTRLPQIGPKTAERIVSHRQTHGPFKTIDALTDVKGIGPKTLQKLRALVTLQTP